MLTVVLHGVAMIYHADLICLSANIRGTKLKLHTSFHKETKGVLIYLAVTVFLR